MTKIKEDMTQKQMDRRPGGLVQERYSHLVQNGARQHHMEPTCEIPLFNEIHSKGHKCI